MSTPDAPEKLKRRQQIAQSYKMAKRSDPRIGLWILLAFLVGAAVGFGLFYFLPGPNLAWGILGGILLGFLAATIVFGRRAQRAAYTQMEGQVGAAAAVLRTLRRGWKVEPAVGFTKPQDVVHRVVGPPGIILVGEGQSSRVRQLLTTERRKHERVAAETPIHEVVCGNGEDEVPLPKLQRHVQKLGRNIKPAEMTDLLYRLKALDANRSNIPLPKGPVPTSMKGHRGNLRGR
jgi:F0F1-type ATP synthase assembly protein I